MTREKTVGVIVINYGKYRVTAACADSVLQSDYRPLELHIIDNGSAGEDYQWLKNHYRDKAQVYRIEKNIGYVGAVNFGLKKCLEKQHEYILIINNDSIIEKHALQALVQTSRKHSDHCIVSGKVYHFDQPEYLQYIGQGCADRARLIFPPLVKNRMEKDTGQYDREMEMGMLDDIFWLLPDVVFKKVGYYSPYFFLYGEQNDYALRAVDQGFKLIYTPRAKLWHKGSITTSGGDKKSPRLTFWRTKSFLVLLTLHSRPGYLFTRFFKLLFRKVIIGLPVSLVKEIRGHKGAVKNSYATLWALVYFVTWFFWRRPDKGFNPFR